MNNSNIVAYAETKYMQLSELTFNFGNQGNAFCNLAKYVKIYTSSLSRLFVSLLAIFLLLITSYIQPFPDNF